MMRDPIVVGAWVITLLFGIWILVILSEVTAHLILTLMGLCH